MTRVSVVLDTTVLSNFASSESVEWLTSTVDRLGAPPAVETELKKGVEIGHQYLESAVAAIEEGDIIVSSLSESARNEHPNVFARLDFGEAEALCIALTGGTLATDDRTARRLAREYEVPVTGSVGLLVRGIADDELTVRTADKWLTTWTEKRGYYAPVESVAEVLSDELPE